MREKGSQKCARLVVCITSRFSYFTVFSCVDQPYYSENHGVFKDCTLFYPHVLDTTLLPLSMTLMTNQEQSDILKSKIPFEKFFFYQSYK